MFLLVALCKTVLMMACNYTPLDSNDPGNMEMVQFLLTSGADVNALNNDNMVRNRKGGDVFLVYMLIMLCAALHRMH